MVYNKGTVSFDQWLEELYKLENKKTGLYHSETLMNFYLEGMDIEEALMNLKDEKE